MSILLVTYDLKKPGQDYTNIYSTLKSAKSWYHFMESNWLLNTTETPSQWYDKIKSYIDQSDNLLIVDVTNSTYHGFLKKEVWDWITNHKE